VKYVALLALNQVVESHPYLVSLHEDVILECIDDADISIRLRALDLVVGMVNIENLPAIVGRLMLQLRNSPLASASDDPQNERGSFSGVTPMADSDEEDAEQSIKRAEHRSNQAPPLPDDYRISIIRRILEMCSRNTYSNISDFDWYIDILIQLIRHVPTIMIGGIHAGESGKCSDVVDREDVANEIGKELRNVAVRVKSSRREVTRAVELLLSVDRREQMLPSSGSLGVLEPAVWIVGEYASFLTDTKATLTSLIHSSTFALPNRTLAAYIQAAPKVFACFAGTDQQSWTGERQTQVTLLLARLIDFLESLNTHPYLEVQERAVEFLELMRLVNEAIAVYNVDGDNYSDFTDPPLLLTEAMPSLFSGIELNPVATDAQRRVPIPDELDLNKNINENLTTLLQVPDLDFEDVGIDDFYRYYNHRPAETQAPKTAAARLAAPEVEVSYQQANGEYLDPDLIALRRAERRERHKDDPFYIPSGENSGTATPLNTRLKGSLGEDLDIDSIPIMELKLDNTDILPTPGKRSTKAKPRRRVDILGDESIGDEPTTSTKPAPATPGKGTKSLLEVDSSGLQSLSLGAKSRHDQLDVERQNTEEVEMAKAMKEIERLRLEMQRASEKVEVKNGPADGVVVKRKKKKKKAEGVSAGDEDGQAVATKKKKKPSKAAEVIESTNATIEEPATEESTRAAASEPIPPKQKPKRRQVTFDEPEGGATA